ncbi:MAG: NnrS family protein [Polyangiaceae bacterium]
MSALPLLGEPARGAPSETLAPILRKGFRPFFLAGAGFMALALPLWLLALTGVVTPDAYFGGLLWHAHEMVFGFSAAILAGFLLTAVGNWTGRETAVGRPLLALVALWLAGRVGVSFASLLPRGVPALLDLSFLPAVGVVLARPLVATQNRRNFVMLGVLGALTIANLVMHLDALGRLGAAPGVAARHAALASVDVVVFVIAVMAGRIFPMFTRNGTGVAAIKSRPRLDAAALASLAALTLTDVVLPEHTVGSVVAGVAAVLLAARAIDWGARHTLRIPLLWVLHAGYAFLPLGLALRAATLVSSSIPPSAATHALTAGGIRSSTPRNDGARGARRVPHRPSARRRSRRDDLVRARAGGGARSRARADRDARRVRSRARDLGHALLDGLCDLRRVVRAHLLRRARRWQARLTGPRRVSIASIRADENRTHGEDAVPLGRES